MTPTWYDILGVERDATTVQIKSAWRSATDKFEPGSSGTGASQFKMFNDAADVLLDPARRSAYDATLAAESPVTSLVKSPVGPVASPVTEHEAEAQTKGHWGEPVDPDSEVAEEADKPTSSGRVAGTGLKVVALGVLPLLVAVAVAIALILTSRVSTADRAEDARLGAPAAAERAVTRVLSFDYKRLEADRLSASKFLTPSYKKQYLETYALLEVGEDGKPGPAVSTKTIVKADVVGSAISDAEPERVRVVVYVNQVSEKTGQDPSIFQNRAQVTMAKVGSEWLIDDIQSY